MNEGRIPTDGSRLDIHVKIRFGIGERRSRRTEPWGRVGRHRRRFVPKLNSPGEPGCLTCKETSTSDDRRH